MAKRKYEAPQRLTGRGPKPKGMKFTVWRKLRLAAGRRRARAAAAREAAPEMPAVGERVEATRAALRAQLGEPSRGRVLGAMHSAAAIGAWLAAGGSGKGGRLSLSARAEAAAEATGISVNTVEKIISTLLRTGALYAEDTSRRGHGSERYLDVSALTEAQREAVSAHVQAALKQPSRRPDVTRMAVQRFILAEFGVDWSVDRVGCLLGDLGFAYGELKRVAGGAPSPARVLQKRIYIIQLHDALAAGHILVWIDESYANVRMANGMGWAEKDGMAAASVTTDGPGDRLCFIHGISRYGLIGQVGVDAPYGSTDPRATGYMIFPAQKGGKADYHGNFDGAIFMAWVRNRLLPAVKAQFPDAFGPARTRHLTMVFDNAKYHCGTTADLAPLDPRERRWHPLGLGKPALFEQLRALGCDSLAVAHAYKGADGTLKRVTINTPTTDKESARKGVAGKVASLDEIRLAAEDYLVKNCPAVLRNDLEALLETEGNVHVLWNAPNFPDGAPIELVWGVAKGYAAALWTKGRTRETLAEQLRDGFYTNKPVAEGTSGRRGGDFAPRGVGVENAAAVKLIDHVLSDARGIQGAIEADAVLSGTLTTLDTDPKWLTLARASHARNAMRVLVRNTLAEMLADGEAAAAAEAEAADEGADGPTE